MNELATPLTPEELGRLGGGVVGYVREINPADARQLLGESLALPAKAKLFCLYNADGTPVSISGSREAALGSAMEHDLVPSSVH